MKITISFSSDERNNVGKIRCQRAIEAYASIANAFLEDKGVKLSDIQKMLHIAGDSSIEMVMFLSFLSSSIRPKCALPFSFELHRRLMSAIGIRGEKLKEMDFYFLWATGGVDKLDIPMSEGRDFIKYLWKDSDIEFDKFRL